MKIKNLRTFRLKNKLVLYRPAYDVPLRRQGGKFIVHDDTRIQATLPTLQYLLKQNCRIVILTWCGRPDGKRVAKYRLDPVAKRLGQLLRHPVKKLDDCVGPKVQKAVRVMKPKDIVMLENVRFHPEEETKDKRFIKALSSLGEIWVFDAFAQAHRDVASIVGPPRFLPAVSGFLVENEITTLQRMMKSPRRPFVAIIGGAKIEDKLMLLKILLRQADYVLLGGVSANTILQVKGIQVGKSKVEPKMVKAIRQLKITDLKLKIPVDVVTAKSLLPRARTQLKPVGRVSQDDRILDIGPDTARLYQSIIARAKTVLWSGPMGYFELPQFSRGTKDIAQAVAKTRGETIIGGGDTISAVEEAGVLNQIDFVSTGGGAMLDYLAGEKLPGLKYLSKK
ncbi:MAG: phosphoglycerate kinase [Patescibacteria group bacterium]|nr:phosphoglycerate kinase [Patescibacteria group bacterium]